MAIPDATFSAVRFYSYTQYDRLRLSDSYTLLVFFPATLVFIATVGDLIVTAAVGSFYRLVISTLNNGKATSTVHTLFIVITKQTSL